MNSTNQSSKDIKHDHANRLLRRLKQDLSNSSLALTWLQAHRKLSTPGVNELCNYVEQPRW